MIVAGEAPATGGRSALPRPPKGQMKQMKVKSWPNFPPLTAKKVPALEGALACEMGKKIFAPAKGVLLGVLYCYSVSVLLVIFFLSFFSIHCQPL